MTIDSKALLVLAERCEAATGADRELDCLLWAEDNALTLEWQGHCLVAGSQGVIGWIDPGKDQRNFSCNRSDRCFGRIKAYTASLDAALTLVPEGWQWVVSQQFGQPFAGCGGSPTDGWLAWHVDAATPALALCAAALRARAAMQVAA